MNIERLKQKILDLAIRGKLVPQDPNDESATELVERIRKEKEKLDKEGKIKLSKNDSFIFKGSDNCYYEKINDEITLINEAVVPKGFDNVVWIKGKSFLSSMVTAKIKDPEFRYIDIDAINNKTCAVNKPKIIETSKAPSRAKRKLFEGCTLFSMVRPYLRNIAYIDKNLGDCIASTGFYVFNPLNFVDGEYLYYLVSSDFVVNSLNFYMKGDNSPSINSDNIEEFYFPIPSLTYQKKVVKYLKQLIPIMELIEQEKNVLNDIISKVKIKILDYYFGENSCYKSYYENVSTVGSEIKILDFLRKPINKDERNNRLSKTNVKYPYYGANGQAGWINEFLLDGEYVLVGEDGSPFLNRYANKAYIVYGRIWVNNHAHILKSNKNNRYLMHYLNWFNYDNYVSGTTRLKLNQAKLKSIPFPVLSIDIQTEIADKIDFQFKIIDKIKEQLI